MASLCNTNSGIHQLPSNCYPASESDDEDSFVVLNNSLGPDIDMDRVLLNTEPISTETIQASLDSIANILTKNTSQNRESESSSIVDSSHIGYQSSEISADEIQSKVDNLIKENLKLKETLAQNNIAMKKQVDTITQWQTEVQRVQESHKEKFSEMKKYINILKTENEELKGAIKKYESVGTPEDAQKTKEMLSKQMDNIKQFELEAAQKKIKELEKAVDILSSERAAAFKELSSTQAELRNVTAHRDSLILELDLVKEMRKKLSDAQCEVQQFRDEIVELRDTNNNLRDEIENLSKACGRLRETEEELIKKKHQLMDSQIQITQLNECHAESILEKDKTIELLRKEIKVSKTNVDEVVALKAQLDLYKNDFELVETQRAEAVADKNRIADDLQHLQRRNKQLLEEIDQLRSGFVPVQKEELRPTASGSPPAQRPICPICGAKFASILLVQDHVDYCLANTNT